MKLKQTSSSHPIFYLLLRFLVKRPDRGGFTLIELLVSMLVASLMVSGLLYLVVEILQINQRETSRSNTQRDLQMAMDYIVRDVREATYVYGVTQPVDSANVLGPKESCLATYGDALARGKDGKCTGLLSFLPGSLTQANASGTNYPVLAFWKPEPLPSTLRSGCKARAADIGKSSGAGFSPALNSVPCVAQRMYTLVVYSLHTEPSSGSLWRGKARIKRYQLPHFTESAVIGDAANAGWAAPIAKDKRPLTWPIGDKSDPVTNVVTPNVYVPNAPPDAARSSNDVLTDFADSQPNTPYESGYCPNGFDAPSGFSGANFNRAFYVCVRSGSLSAPLTGGTAAANAVASAASAGQGINPEVHIVLRGNAAGLGGIPLLSGDLPFQMETRVLSRGVYGKLAN